VVGGPPPLLPPADRRLHHGRRGHPAGGAGAHLAVGIGPPVPEWTPGLVAGRYRAAHQGRDVGPLEVRLIDEATALVTETRPGPDRAVTLRRRHGTWVEDPAVTLG